jgi:hypothetical protein
LKSFNAESFARDAALADAEFASQVGTFVSVEYDDDNRVATYLFEAAIAGYKGWRWAITLAKVDEKSEPTICDVVLLPGPDSLIAPDHIPYRDRIEPADITPGVIVPSLADDSRLVPGIAALPQDEDLDEVILERDREYVNEDEDTKEEIDPLVRALQIDEDDSGWIDDNEND